VINQKPLRYQRFKKLSLLPLSVAALILMTIVDRVDAQGGAGYQTPQEREVYGDVPGSSSKGSILDATNPMELMNRIRQSTAMDEATPPSDAIDDALRALDAAESDPALSSTQNSP